MDYREIIINILDKFIDHINDSGDLHTIIMEYMKDNINKTDSQIFDDSFGSYLKMNDNNGSILHHLSLYDYCGVITTFDVKMDGKDLSSCAIRMPNNHNGILLSYTYLRNISETVENWYSYKMNVNNFDDYIDVIRCPIMDEFVHLQSLRG